MLTHRIQSVISIVIVLLTCLYCSLSQCHTHLVDHDHSTTIATILTSLPQPLVDLSLLVMNDPILLLYSCTFLLSVFPLFLLVILPNNVPNFMERILVSFALGTMLSDVFLHLLPETLTTTNHHHHHHHHHSHTFDSPPFRLLLGFLVFFTIERIMNFLSDVSSSASVEQTQSVMDCVGKHTHNRRSDQSKSGSRTKKKSTTSSSIIDKDGNEIDRHKTKHVTLPTKSKVSVSAFIHIFATSIHVASDGLLLAMAFINSPSTGLATFLSLFLHEIPHRLSDWALLQGPLNMSRHHAFLAQLWISVMSVGGVIIGSVMVSKSAMDQILPIVTGGLIYVATVGVIPELLGNHHHHHHHSHHDEHEHEHEHDHHHPSSPIDNTSRFIKFILILCEFISLGAGILLMGHHDH